MKVTLGVGGQREGAGAAFPDPARGGGEGVTADQRPGEPGWYRISDVRCGYY